MGRKSEDAKKKLPFRLVLGYGLGHVFNDVCASLWFTYLLIFLQKVSTYISLHPANHANGAKHWSCVNTRVREQRPKNSFDKTFSNSKKWINFEQILSIHNKTFYHWLWDPCKYNCCLTI